MERNILKLKPSPTISNIGQMLLTVLTISLALSYTLSLLLSSYYQISLTESLIFTVNDGWCDPIKQGIGIHCFGDFFAWMQVSFANPWSEGTTAYPPFSLVFFKLIKALYVMSNSSNLVLLIYLAILTIAMVFPIIHLYVTKRITSLRTCLLMATLLFTLAPTVMVLDRGNNIGFAIPVIYLCCIYAINEKDRAFLISVTILCLWKPQLGVLSLYFIYLGKYKWFLRWVFITCLSYVVSFSLFGFQSIFKNAERFLSNLVGYQGYVEMPGFFPSNWSFVNFVSVLINLPPLLSNFPSVSLESMAQLPKLSITIISSTFLILSLAVIRIRVKAFGKLELLTLLCLLSFLTPSVTFSYYISILLPIVVIICYGILVLSQSPKSNFKSEQDAIQNFIMAILGTKRQRIIFAGVISTCLVSWPITWGLLGVASTSAHSKIGIAWTAGLFIMNVWYFSILFGRSRK